MQLQRDESTGDYPDLGSQLSRVVSEELAKQRERGAAQEARVSREKAELDEVLKASGKSSLADRRRGVAADDPPDCSVVVFPLVSDGGVVMTREEATSSGSTPGAMGLISPLHPDFPTCSAYCRSLPHPLAKSETLKLRADLHALNDRLRLLETDNALRMLEVQVLCRVLNSPEVALSGKNAEVVQAIAEGRQRAADEARNRAQQQQQQQQQQGLAAPHDEFTVPGEPTAADVCKRAFSNLSDDSVVNLLRAVYAEPCLLRVMDQIPSGA
ncbi:hypothetical protein DIPPA_04213 [Diplonema papillatum]|nr:hypothetical protein DIPPA_04213 [Diplonema papillatum]